MIGKTLGPFRVSAKLGSGGMGEVYRATDTRLGREVAIKVLPAELAAEEGLRRRLEREARAISGLNHPHICTLHEIGREGDTAYLVMELLHGETLAERLERGPLPVPETLRLAAQIARALAAAHGQGFVHRDLKPANVMLTQDGAKLLDFGLAKPTATEPEPDSLSASPTLSGPLTAEGALVGTLPYMAPEQVEGRPADPRTDVFALGSLLYEMLTGARAFPAESRAGLVAAILKEEPQPLAERAPSVPPALERLTRKCLAKSPDERWQSAADLADELSWIAATTAADAPASPSAGRSSARRGAVVAALLAAGLGGGVGWWLGGSSAPETAHRARPATHLTIPLPPEAPFFPSELSALAVSPNGRAIVYSGGTVADHRLYRRDLERDRVVALEGTEGAVGPFFAPDGGRLGFFAGPDLRIVALDGGPAQRIVSGSPVTRGAVWLENGDIVLSPNKAGPLILVPSGEPDAYRPLTRLDPELGSGHSWPHLYADGTAALVTVIGPQDRSYDEADVVAIDLTRGEQRVVVEGGSQARLLPSGHLVFVRRGELFAAPFDGRAMALTAPPRAVLPGVLSDPASGAAHLAVSSAGTLVYARGASASSSDRGLAWLDAQGEKHPLEVALQAYGTPAISPDGRQVALSISTASDDIWILDLERGVLRRLTFGGRNLLPVWTPDGSRITFASVREGGYPGIYSVPAAGGGEEEVLLDSGVGGARPGGRSAYFPGSWSPDGSRLAVSRFSGPSAGADIEIVRPGEPPRPFLATRFNEGAPRISPDGAWLAYSSDASGEWQVYVTSFPEPGAQIQVSTRGGTQPVWADDQRLFFRSGDRLLAAEISSGPRPEIGAVTLVYAGDDLVEGPPSPTVPFFDVAPDGRPLLLLGKPLPRVERLEVVLDWLTELESLVPTP